MAEPDPTSTTDATGDSWELKPAADLALPPSERWRAVEREDGLVASSCRLVWRSCLKGALKLGFGLEVHGREFLPREPPFVVVANHTSHLDALLLSSVLPVRLRDVVSPLAAEDVFFESKGRSAFSALFLNALPVRRSQIGHRTLATLRARLVERPAGYVLFPEGTRSRDGEMTDFKPGLGMLVAGTDVPVVPCFIRGALEAWPPDSRLPRPGRVRLDFGESHHFDHLPNRRAGWTTVAETMQSAVAALGDGEPAA